MRKMAVPTDDRRVRDRLRAYGEPITLFGEGVSSARPVDLLFRADGQPGDRRDRLKYVQEQIENAKGDRAIPDFMDEDSSDEDDEEVGCT